jgi:hypothetical protein
MNVYVVVEGRVVEKATYRVWIPEINRALSPVTFLPEVVGDNKVYIVSGDGYPQYFEVIRAALEDVATGDTFQRLVICVDSEDMSLDEKRNEVVAFVQATPYAHVDYRVVVQHFCFETWVLGNRAVARRNPQLDLLKKYRAVYDVWRDDPEGLPALANEGLNRSQFAFRYLRATFMDRYSKISYSKNNPKEVAYPKYFEEVRKRLISTAHIQSFQAFLDAFV